MEKLLAGQEIPILLGLLVIGVIYLPAAIWDARTGRYRGYFNRPAIATLILVGIAGGVLSYIYGMPGPDVSVNMGVYVTVVLFVSRLCVEWRHYREHKVWLHRQYHKLTDHDDPRGASP